MARAQEEWGSGGRCEREKEEPNLRHPLFSFKKLEFQGFWDSSHK